MKFFRITRVEIPCWGGFRGVRLTEFIDRSRKGTYQGHAYNGADLTPIVELPNHVPQEFDAWVDKEVEALANKGCIARWSEVADVSTHPKPNVTLPVGIEPTKPRFILRRSVPEHNVQTLRVQDGRSREGRTVFMARSTPNFHGPQVRVSQRASTPRLMDVFRDVLEGECTTYGPSYVSDGVNRHISTTRSVAPSHNTSATLTCLSPRGSMISGCPIFKQLKLSHPHNNAKRRER